MRTYLIALYLAALCACPAAQALRYTLTLLGTPSTGFEDSDGYLPPVRINNKGDIIGGATRGPFLYRNGTVHYLWSEDEPFRVGFLADINNHGVVAGQAWPTDGSRPSLFTYSTTGRGDFNLSRAEMVAVRPELYPWGFNDRGMIVGHIGFNEDSRAAVYSDGELRVLPSLVPGASAIALAVNNRGQIVGSAETQIGFPAIPSPRAVIWSNGRIHDLGLLPGGRASYGNHINDHGEAVGVCNVSDPPFIAGFIYRNGVMTQIPVPSGVFMCGPRRINNPGEVLVLYYPRPGTFEFGNWLYRNGLLHDLDQIVSEATGWDVISAGFYDINDPGEIVGLARYRSNGIVYVQGILLVPSH